MWFVFRVAAISHNPENEPQIKYHWKPEKLTNVLRRSASNDYSDPAEKSFMPADEPD